MKPVYMGMSYEIRDPRPDYDDSDDVESDIAKRRLMMRHDHNGPRFFIAPANVLHAGWVVGVES